MQWVHNEKVAAYYRKKLAEVNCSVPPLQWGSENHPFEYQTFEVPISNSWSMQGNLIQGEGLDSLKTVRPEGRQLCDMQQFVF